MSVYDPMIFEFSESDIHWPGGRLTYRLWQEKRGSDLCPARSSFSPRDLITTLPMIMLIDVRPKPEGFVMRLVGTGITHYMGKDPTGSRIIDLRNGEHLVKRFAKLAERKQPYLLKAQPVPWESDEKFNYSVVMLPLASDGTNVDMILANLHFDMA